MQAAAGQRSLAPAYYDTWNVMFVPFVPGRDAVNARLKGMAGTGHPAIGLFGYMLSTCDDAI
jgi:hypothetical protein